MQRCRCRPAQAPLPTHPACLRRPAAQEPSLTLPGVPAPLPSPPPPGGPAADVAEKPHPGVLAWGAAIPEALLCYLTVGPSFGRADVCRTSPCVPDAPTASAAAAAGAMAATAAAECRHRQQPDWGMASGGAVRAWVHDPGGGAGAGCCGPA